MRGGNLREPLKVYSITKTINSLGEPIRTNVLFKTVRGEIVYDNGEEKENNGQMTALQTITFNIRYDASITETMLIEFRGNLFDIRYISHIIKVKTIIKTTKRKQ